MFFKFSNSGFYPNDRLVSVVKIFVLKNDYLSRGHLVIATEINMLLWMKKIWNRLAVVSSYEYVE